MSYDPHTNNTELSSIVNSNAILLEFEGWIKYIEGFSRGIESSKTVESATVNECIGEMLEFMKQFKPKLLDLLFHCEEILEENESLKQIPILEPEQEDKEVEE